MSLTDRNRAHAAPPAYQPVTPPAGPPPAPPNPPGRSDRYLWLIAVVLFALAIALVVYNLSRPPGSATPSTGESAAIPSAATTPTPLLPPRTPDARDQAGTAAIVGYKAYVAAYDKAANAGGSDKLPGDLAATVDGPMAKQVLGDLRSTKAGGFAGSGSAVAYARVDALGELTDKVPSARLATCLDQTGLKVTKDGKPFSGTPRYITEDITMHRVGGTWKVYDRTSEILKDGDCRSNLGPSAR